MFQYLTFLGVLKDQITSFHHSQATPIEDALYLLAKNTNMRRGSPILIYVFFHSPVVRPKRIGDDESGMLYSRFFELVGRISEKHGDNVVILDTNFPDLDPTAAVQLGMQPYVVVAASSDEDQSGRNLARELIPDLLRMLSTGSLGVVLEIQRRSRNFQKIIPQMLIQKLNIERQKRSLSPCFRCMRTPNNRPIFGGALALAKFQDFMITIFLDEEDEVRQGIPTDDAV
ncbi:hypothetical protein B0H14DRAFT_768421 [Mycena olivaceomarginata]|nr:hypothetical protein B0H14DRAFT_768421 [Mycena olivaceomarginata]